MKNSNYRVACEICGKEVKFKNLKKWLDGTLACRECTSKDEHLQERRDDAYKEEYGNE